MSQFITECNAKRKEILDAKLDTADDTNIPTEEDIISDIEVFIDNDGDYYNCWGVTDNYDSNCLHLTKEEDFYILEFNVALIEKPFFDGLSFSDVKELFHLLSTDEVYPIEIQSDYESSAMGFITSEAANEIDYAYEAKTRFGCFIKDILNDMDKESEEHVYEYQGLKIWLERY